MFYNSKKQSSIYPFKIECEKTWYVFKNKNLGKQNVWIKNTFF